MADALSSMPVATVDTAAPLQQRSAGHPASACSCMHSVLTGRDAASNSHTYRRHNWAAIDMPCHNSAS